MGASVNLDFVRGFNDAAVLTHLRGREDAERGDIALATGLTPQAVSKILARLLDDGLIESVGRRQGARGKPATLYRLRAEAAQSIGVNADRDVLEVVMLDLAGGVLGALDTPMPKRVGPDQLLEAIVEIVQALMATAPRNANVIGVGAALPGPVDYDTGAVRGYRWWPDPDAVPLRSELTRRLRLPVVIDRSTNAAIQWVAWRQGEDMTDTILALLDSGVGGALWLDGRLRRGTHSAAAEFGHLIIEPDGPACDCGRHGCVEAIYLAARAAGDVPRASRAVAIGLADAVQVADVSQVILSGYAVAGHARTYLDAIRAELATTFIERSGATIGLQHDTDRTTANGAAVSVLGAFYGRPAPVVGRPVPRSDRPAAVAGEPGPRE